MTFIIQGINGSEVLPLGKLFKPEGIAKIEASAVVHPIDEKEKHGPARQYSQQAVVDEAYRTVNDLRQPETTLSAEQIMSSPVVTVTPEMTINDVVRLFQKSRFRHLPVVSEAESLVGMISDRDILHYAAGLGDNFQPLAAHRLNGHIEPVMKTPVLTASQDTDVRHIARLFVSQRVGAMPIVNAGRVVGIITRNDILEAVMSNFIFELWA